MYVVSIWTGYGPADQLAALTKLLSYNTSHMSRIGCSYKIYKFEQDVCVTAKFTRIPKKKYKIVDENCVNLFVKFLIFVDAFNPGLFSIIDELIIIIFETKQSL